MVPILTLERLVVDPRYLRLAPQQQVFVKTCCQNGNNKIQAGIAAWQCKSTASAQTMANRLLREKPEAVSLIRDFFAGDILDELMTKEQWLAMASERARKAEKDADCYKFMTLIGQANGWIQKPTEGGDSSSEDEKEKSTLELVHELEKK